MTRTNTLNGGEATAPDRSIPPHSLRNTILLGDVRERLRDLPSSSIDCIVTSPPYFGIRNYGHERQLGTENDIDGWVQHLRAVARELARVLKPTGALWLNLGDGYSRHQKEGAPHKSLLLGPERVARALVQDGWILRNQVVWAKSNPMPSSLPDRLSSTHEVVYFFVRSRSYYFDLDAIREPLRTTDPQGATDPTRGYPPQDAQLSTRPANTNTGLAKLRGSGRAGHPLGKNPGDVWTLATAGFRGAHFATFPVSLVERPVLATCPERVCVQCGSPWRRELVDRTEQPVTLGKMRPGCDCRAATSPGVVLDPFMGAGTVALAAEKHGRDWLGVELNPEYVQMSWERIRKARAARARATRLGDRGGLTSDRQAA
jgi:site-specific DNA-methyltransferase (adenine-specific)